MSHSVLLYFIVATVLTEYLTGFVKNATILKKPRVYLRGKSEFLNDLLTCGFCLSVWVALFIVQVSYFVTPNLPVITDIIILDNAITWLLVAAFSNIWHGFRDRYLETYKDKRYYRKEELYDDE